MSHLKAILLLAFYKHLNILKVKLLRFAAVIKKIQQRRRFIFNSFGSQHFLYLGHPRHRHLGLAHLFSHLQEYTNPTTFMGARKWTLILLLFFEGGGGGGGGGGLAFLVIPVNISTVIIITITLR